MGHTIVLLGYAHLSALSVDGWVWLIGRTCSKSCGTVGMCGHSVNLLHHWASVNLESYPQFISFTHEHPVTYLLLLPLFPRPFVSRGISVHHMSPTGLMLPTGTPFELFHHRMPPNEFINMQCSRLSSIEFTMGTLTWPHSTHKETSILPSIL